MKIGNRKLIVVIMLLLTINIYAVTLEQRLIDKKHAESGDNKPGTELIFK